MAQDELGAFMHASCDDVLACMDLLRGRGVRIASADPPDRVTREIRRRADAIGVSPASDAIVRLVGALMLETGDERAVTRRGMSLGPPLVRVAGDPALGRSAVAA